MPKQFEHDPKEGLLCPWCMSSIPIRECQHNPFALMDECDRLRQAAQKGEEALTCLATLKRLLS